MLLELLSFQEKIICIYIERLIVFLKNVDNKLKMILSIVP